MASMLKKAVPAILATALLHWFSGGLHAPGTATVVREQAGNVVTTDGPFIESKEQIGGITILKAPDLDAALAWARKLARAIGVPIEVRPFTEGHG